ncbi:gametocyte-specific factor 1-like [Ornithorhynchus anatinus]|uniref:gametocyte-specific factor 1-like n=1 Tax=Ornithorhynchus anatinus TaxID=9258 RepID=UPI00028F38D9|nr:gametocyte-specific factor 1-like [Ornithorhynchus anatinus]
MEQMLQCPYDKNHKIRASRMQYHLAKCRENNPDMARGKLPCPFNACHVTYRAEMERHMCECPDRSRDLGHNESFLTSEENKALSSWQAPPPKENWEPDEAEESTAAPFVFGAWAPKALTCQSDDNPEKKKDPQKGRRNRRKKGKQEKNL